MLYRSERGFDSFYSWIWSDDDAINALSSGMRAAWDAEGAGLLSLYVAGELHLAYVIASIRPWQVGYKLVGKQHHILLAYVWFRRVQNFASAWRTRQRKILFGLHQAHAPLRLSPGRGCRFGWHVLWSEDPYDPNRRPRQQYVRIAAAHHSASAP